MSLQKILDMISTVNPKDHNKLDEIDAHVANYIDPEWKPILMDYVSYQKWRIYKTFGEDRDVHATPSEYTRSRDCIKRIRPKGWFVKEFGHWDLTGEFYFQIIHQKSRHQIFVEALPTEELAELCTTLQAIDHERKNGT